MESTVTTIRFPDMRANLKAFSESLADENYQRHIWINHETPPSRDSFSDVAHFFYDDTTLSKNSDGCIGLFLYDRSEAEAARKIVNALDAVFSELAHRGPIRTILRPSIGPESLLRRHP